MSRLKDSQYKNKKVQGNGSLFISNGAAIFIGGGGKDKNQVLVHDGSSNGIITADLKELLELWNPNPRYICLVSADEPKKRPDKEPLEEGDLWYKPAEKLQYTYYNKQWVLTSGPPGVTTIVSILQPEPNPPISLQILNGSIIGVTTT